MTPREHLRQLIEELPEAEVPAAERALAALVSRADPLRALLESAPLDDEPETEEERDAVAEARADRDAGRLTSHDEVKRSLGIA
ncbi:MAG: hypothetical protein ACREQY_09275 [Candidatus Binatia bacterium]